MGKDASSDEAKTICCCCCKRPRRTPARGEKVVLDGADGVLSQNSEVLLPATVEQQHNNMSNSHSFQSSQDHISSTTTTRQHDRPPTKCGRTCCKCFKKFITFFFSNVGLCSLVVGYSILGGFIFKTLEAPYEIEKRHHVNGKRVTFAKAIWNLTQSSELYFYEQNYTRQAEKILVEFQKEILAATKNGWDGTDGDVEPQWSFPGSLLYSVTVITTIGYGHIAPKTVNGRLVTIFYALIGIPLTLLCLANMGAFLGDCFRLLYKHTCRLLTWMCCPPDQGLTRKKTNAVTRSVLNQELDPLHSKGGGSVNNIDKLSVVENLRVKRIPSANRLDAVAGGSQGGSRNEINIVVEDYDTVAPKSKEKTEQIRVPIFVSIMIIALYIFGGAAMFSVWEEWDYLEGGYFCFITLSTIGFGDYVPGSIGRADSVDSRQKLIICCVYLIVGLSIIAMCFNLMQEDVRAKFVWLGEQIGLIDKK